MKGAIVISLERQSHVVEIRGLYVIKKGYCQNSSMLENVTGSITDQKVKTFKKMGNANLKVEGVGRWYIRILVKYIVTKERGRNWFRIFARGGIRYV
jgi:hypothetical protein